MIRVLIIIRKKLIKRSEEDEILTRNSIKLIIIRNIRDLIENLRINKIIINALKCQKSPRKRNSSFIARNSKFNY